MRNVVIILGAGASYDYGAPLMKDFYQVASENFVNTDDEKVRDHFSTVFDFINRLQKAQAKANIDLQNIEQVYTALEMAKLLGLNHLKASNKSWKQMDDSMKFFLTHNIESRTLLPQPPHSEGFKVEKSKFNARNQSRNLQSVADYIPILLKKDWKVSILSFNYDLVAEAVLARQYLKVDYCLDNQTAHTNEKTVPLLKLHGSINWQEKKTGRNVSLDVTPYSELHEQQNHHLSNMTSNNIKFVTNFSQHFTPFVIPPVWNKATYQTSLHHVWKHAAQKLSKASHVYCLGYSLPQTDGFFKQLYALGTVGDNPFLQFKVFDIEPEDQPMGVKSRYLDLLGRGAENVFAYHDSGVDGLCTSLYHLSRSYGH